MYCAKRWTLLAAALLVAGMFVDAADAGRCGRRGGCGRRSNSCGMSRGCSTGGCYTGGGNMGSCSTGSSCNTGSSCYQGDCSTGACPMPSDEAAPAMGATKVKRPAQAQSAARVSPVRVKANGARG